MSLRVDRWAMWIGGVLLALAELGDFGGACSVQAAEAAGPRKLPNVIFILCDDLGYGDVRCNNPEGKIATPAVDRLAAEGMRFTDAHTTSSVCTPTRYGVLTGRYNWRSRLQSGVLGGTSPRLIEPDRLTVAELLRRQGYHTACIGKWHLGMDWPRKADAAGFNDQIEKGPEGWSVDYTRPITGGPTSVGFDYYFGISASLDMVPYTYIENDRVTVVPTVDKAFAMMPGKPATTRRGPGAAEFDATNVLPDLTQKTLQYIAGRGPDARAGKPFFLYLPLNAPHTPIAPTKEWLGRSGLNPYGDFVMQVDDTLRQILAVLDEQKLTDNTLLVFTSDNGCSPQADFPALQALGHQPSAEFRGHKADIFDGGHRVPFIVRWPGRVKAGSVCDQLVSLVDFFATCADVAGVRLPDNAGDDSVSLLPALLGTAGGPLREALVHHSIEGKFAVRQGRWKLCLCPGSGGWSAPREPLAIKQGLPPVQLYDMQAEVGEQRNLQAEHPEIVQRLTTLLEKYVADGRSTPGAPQKNDVAIDIWKKPAAKPKAKAK